MSEKITYTLTVNADGFTTVVNNATKETVKLEDILGKTNKTSKDTTSTIRDLTLAYSGMKSVITDAINFTKQFTDASIAQNRATQNLTTEQIAYSKELENTTGVNDTIISQMQTSLEVMGLNNEQVKEATKYTADLVAGGLSLEDSMKKSAAMVTKNYSELGELIPEIKVAKDETEKQALATEYFAKKAELAIQGMDGMAGAEKRTANAMEDAKAKFGAVLNEALLPILQALPPIIEFVGNNLPTAIGVVSGILAVSLIPKIYATTTALYAQATALTAATAGLNILIAGLVGLAALGVTKYIVEKTTIERTVTDTKESLESRLSLNKELSEKLLSLQISDNARKLELENQLKNTGVVILRAGLLNQFDLIKENNERRKKEQSKLSDDIILDEIRLHKLSTDELIKNFNNSLKTFKENNQKRAKLSEEQLKRQEEELKKQKDLKDKEADDNLKIIDDQENSYIESQKSMTTAFEEEMKRRNAIRDEYDKIGKQLENDKVASSDAINKQIEDMEVESTETLLDDKMLAFTRENNAWRDKLETDKSLQIEYDAWYELRQKNFNKIIIKSQETTLKEEGKLGLQRLQDMKSLGRAGHDIAKAGAIAETTWSTYEGAQKSYSSLAGIPIIGPALGAAAATIAVIAGLGRIASITAAGTGYQTGGYTGSGNDNEEAGIVHKNEFVTNAQTTSRVGVPALEMLQNNQAVIVPVSNYSAPEFVGNSSSNAIDSMSGSLNALSANLTSGSSQRETFIINNSDFVKITKKIETTRNENSNIIRNKTTRSYV